MNKDNYKNAINQIHASNELKEKTIIKMKQNKSRKISYIKYLSAVAVACLVFSVGFFELNKNENIFQGNSPEITKPKSIAKMKDDLPRFKSINELEDVLQEGSIYNSRRETVKSDLAFNDEIFQTEAALEENSVEDKEASLENVDYSTTNNQVANVDEADIVKTDGEYIYYVARGKVFIVEANELKIVSTIEIKEDKKNFNPCEIFINNDKLIVLGNLYEYEEGILEDEPLATIERDYQDIALENPVDYSSKRAIIANFNTTKAIVYDISDKENLKVIKEFGLDGNYINSRMIGDNIYFLSRKYAYYYDGIKENELLPRVVNGQETKLVECTDIAYFKDSNNYSYMLVGGFNINDNEEMSVETFFGASETMYASEKNLYLAQTEYDGNYYESKTTIYKFALDNSQIILTAKGEVDGYLNNQFSMDEYDGNLRLATTYVISQNTPEQEETTEEGIATVTLSTDIVYGNRLYVLDGDLKEIGRIDNLAEDEKIYSVRFIGKMGYIVTFKQVDPLFVIDLSDPTNPEVKGELKIPGYSSYLHPYDETHIIGIGYNTKDNGHGGITTDNMKMSMFDVSDVENPTEIFSIDIGKSYTYSEILYNHKVLFYKKSENLIGFPVNYNGKSKVELFKIDLENGFEKYAEIAGEKDYYNIERVQFIKDTIYTLHYNRIVAYNLKTLEKINELNLD